MFMITLFLFVFVLFICCYVFIIFLCLEFLLCVGDDTCVSIKVQLRSLSSLSPPTSAICVIVSN